MQKLFINKKSGFTLVETLVSISIFTMSILGLMSILASSISNTSYVKQKITAEYLAQEGIEYVRNLRDNAVLYDVGGAQAGWDVFKAPSLPKFIPCPVSTCPISSSDFSGFIRTIKMDWVPGTFDEVKITSTVTWTQGSVPKSVILSEDLFNWIE